METRNIAVTLNKAREWYSSGDATLKEIALQAFSKNELAYSYKDITTFEKACEALGLNYDIISIVVKDVAAFSRASAAMFKLNIIRKALNLNKGLYLTKDPEDLYIYYPCNPFVTTTSTYYASKISSGEMEVIGKIEDENIPYKVLGGRVNTDGFVGLGNFIHDEGIGCASPNIGFLGCASIEIAQHFGKYFGMLITEAKYGDIVDFKIIEDKYGNTIN